MPSRALVRSHSPFEPNSPCQLTKLTHGVESCTSAIHCLPVCTTRKPTWDVLSRLSPPAKCRAWRAENRYGKFRPKLAAPTGCSSIRKHNSPVCKHRKAGCRLQRRLPHPYPRVWSRRCVVDRGMREYWQYTLACK